MATLNAYTFNHTDGVQEFTVQSYTANGPTTPTSGVLHPNATQQSTSLLFIGKGFPEYGEIVQENVLRLLENFSGTVAPVNAIKGQMWFDTTTDRMKIWNGAIWIEVEQSNFNDPISGDLDLSNIYRLTNFLSMNQDIDMLDVDTFTYHTVVNLADPVNPKDALNFGFADGRYLDLSGTSVMTGSIDMGGFTLSNFGSALDMNTNLISNVVDPVSLQDAVTLNAMNIAIAAVSGGGVTNLTGLTDVTLGVLNVDDMFIFDGVKWINQAPSLYTHFVGVGGDTMTGALTLSGVPTADLHASTKKYVDDEIALVTGGADGVVTGGSFNDLTGTLTLTRSAALPSVNIPGLASSLTSSVVHTDSTDLINTPPKNIIEELFQTVGGYPNVSLSSILSEFSRMFGVQASPNLREIITTTGGTTYNFYGIDYTVGMNNMFVNINGVKQIASEVGHLRIRSIKDPLIPIVMYPSMETGLDGVTTYDFNVNVNSSGNILLSVVGSNLATFGGLISDLNTAAVAASANVTFAMNGGDIYAYSTLPGIASSVVITDVDLLSSIIGSVSFPITIDIPGNWISFPSDAVVETTTIVPLAGADDLGTYKAFILSRPNSADTYRVWFNVFDGTGTPIPTPVVGITDIQVSISVIDSATVVATSLQFALETQASVHFDATISGSTVTVTNKDRGVVVDAADEAGHLTGYTITTTVQGTNNTLTQVTTDLGYKEVGRFGERSSTIEYHVAPAISQTMEVIVSPNIQDQF